MTTLRYFDRRPDVVKIFNDLETYLNYCRENLIEYDPANMYKDEKWRQVDKKPVRFERKPYKKTR